MHGLPPGATLRFALLCAAFGFVWMFLMPFHVSLAFLAVDGTRRHAHPRHATAGIVLVPLVACSCVYR